jgi:hypothetical protein
MEVIACLIVYIAIKLEKICYLFFCEMTDISIVNIIIVGVGIELTTSLSD